MRNRIAKSATVLAVALGLVFAGPVAAMADASATYTSGGTSRATSYWNASTDTMSTTDRTNDGWGSRVRWNLSGNTSSQYRDNTNGAGTTVSFGVWVLPGWQFRVKACSVNNGAELGCSGWSAFSGV